MSKGGKESRKKERKRRLLGGWMKERIEDKEEEKVKDTTVEGMKERR